MGCGSSTMTDSKYELQPSTHVVEERVYEEMPVESVPADNTIEPTSDNRTVQPDPEKKPDGFHLNDLKEPLHLSHAKMGNTLCSNGRILMLQDGATSIEFRTPPKFQATVVPWRFGLIRDIVWCSDLNVFLLLTKDHLLSVSPAWLTTVQKVAVNKPLMDFPISMYEKVKPYHGDASFWRCTYADKRLFVTYSGFGTVVDEYSLGSSSCQLVTRWTSPHTCAGYEGIWCIRYNSTEDRLGMTIMDARNNAWRLELRSVKGLDILWQTRLPIGHGDCELSILPKGEWLIINSCGIRLVQIANQSLKSGVEYQRELKNAVAIGDNYLAIRTKSTVEIHGIKKS